MICSGIINKSEILNYSLVAILLSILTCLFSFCFSDNIILYSLPIIISALVVMFYNVNLSISVGIVFMFINLSFSVYFMSQLFFLFAGISYLFFHKIEIRKFKTSFTSYFMVYFISIIPSYYNSFGCIQSYLKTFYLFIFLLTFVVVSLHYTKERIEKLFDLFVVMSFINALHVIYLFLTEGGRPFGFTGVIYCDLSGLSLVISYYKILTRKNLFVNIICTLTIFLAHLFTQTRNSTISVIITLLALSFFYIVNHKKYGYTFRGASLRISKIVLCVVTVFLSIIISNGNILSRVSDNNDVSTEEMAASIGFIGSLATRIFIWNTAYNAFKEHPLIGIGVYSFPYTSKQYNNLDDLLYSAYVKDAAPHQTEIAVLTETGILGLTGFLIFFSLTYRKIWSLIKKISDLNSWIQYVLVVFLNVYLFFAMLMSDYLSYGNTMAVWGFVLSLAVFYDRFVENDTHEV